MKHDPILRKQIIILRKQGLSYRQIGWQLKITRDMVAGHLYRARKEALEKGLTDERAVSNPTQG